MEALELDEHSSAGEIYEYHKRRAGCTDVAAAILTLAEMIRWRRASGDATNRRPASEQTAKRVQRSTASNDAKPSLVPAAQRKTNGQPSDRSRKARNRADLQVLDEFMPPNETKRLDGFLRSVGVQIDDNLEMQEFLTLLVHYVTKIRKTTCTHSHIHTVLKKVGVPTPGDLGARLRDVSRRKGYIDASNGKAVQLTMKGENWVDIDLPKRAASAKVARKHDQNR